MNRRKKNEYVVIIIIIVTHRNINYAYKVVYIPAQRKRKETKREERRSRNLHSIVVLYRVS